MPLSSIAFVRFRIFPLKKTHTLELATFPHLATVRKNPEFETS